MFPPTRQGTKTNKLPQRPRDGSDVKIQSVEFKLKRFYEEITLNHHWRMICMWFKFGRCWNKTIINKFLFRSNSCTLQPCNHGRNLNFKLMYIRIRFAHTLHHIASCGKLMRCQYIMYTLGDLLNVKADSAEINQTVTINPAAIAGRKKDVSFWANARVKCCYFDTVGDLVLGALTVGRKDRESTLFTRNGM